MKAAALTSPNVNWRRFMAVLHCIRPGILSGGAKIVEARIGPQPQDECASFLSPQGGGKKPRGRRRLFPGRSLIETPAPARPCGAALGARRRRPQDRRLRPGLRQRGAAVLGAVSDPTVHRFATIHAVTDSGERSPGATLQSASRRQYRTEACSRLRHLAASRARPARKRRQPG